MANVDQICRWSATSLPLVTHTENTVLPVRSSNSRSGWGGSFGTSYRVSISKQSNDIITVPAYREFPENCHLCKMQEPLKTPIYQHYLSASNWLTGFDVLLVVDELVGLVDFALRGWYYVQLCMLEMSIKVHAWDDKFHLKQLVCTIIRGSCSHACMQSASLGVQSYSSQPRKPSFDSKMATVRPQYE